MAVAVAVAAEEEEEYDVIPDICRTTVRT